jgi:hypothetical protein
MSFCVRYIELIVYGVRSIFRRLALHAVWGREGNCRHATEWRAELVDYAAGAAAAEYTLLV